MKFQQLAILATIVLNSLASGKMIRSDGPINTNKGLRMLSDTETSLFAGVVYEQPEDRERVLAKAQQVFDENIALQIAESELDEELEAEMDEIDGVAISGRKRTDAAAAAGNKRHPVVLVPGLGGSTILGSRTGMGASHSRIRTLWVGLNMIADVGMKRYPLALKYNVDTNEFNNEVTNLKTQIRDFGGVEGMKIVDAGIFAKMKAFKRVYFEDIVEALESRGYRVGQDLRGAPYDFRRIGDAKVRQEFFTDLQKLIEDTYELNGQSRVHLTGHSLGGVLSLNFLNTYMGDNQAWKDKYIETYTSIQAPFLGAPKALKAMLSGDSLGLKIEQEHVAEYIAQLTSSFSCMLWMMPQVHSATQPIPAQSAINNFVTVAGQDYNNTEAAIAGLFSTFKREPALMTAFAKQIYPLYNMQHPKVNINCIYGYNVATEVGYDYSDAKRQPLVSYGNGDGTVPLESLQFCQQWGYHEDNDAYNITVKEFEFQSHGGILSDPAFLRYLTGIATDTATN